MRRRRVEKRPQALDDILEIAAYLAEKSGEEALAYRFLDAVESTCDQLTANPEIGTTRGYNLKGVRGIRMWRVSHFPNYLVFYRLHEDSPELVRVLHAKRDRMTNETGV